MLIIEPLDALSRTVGEPVHLETTPRALADPSCLAGPAVR